MGLKYLLITILFLTQCFCCLQAQEIKYSGKVVDSLQQPLVYANILAVPEAQGKALSFAVTNNKGEFELNLYKNNTYKITTSFLGYHSDSITLTPITNVIKNIVLSENTSTLDEVVLNYTIPVVVKKDTITYTAESFVTGEERKLQDVLKKLPGVDVDKNGTVTVNGKKVTKVLVEGKTFFTGSSKLALTNLPADAIDKIEVLDNYNEVAMLKGLEENDDMAMNVKLKEDKKQFVFGDVNAGVGVKKHYKAHTSLFYYSPKSTVNFIADANNNGVKSFTSKDYLSFEGGMSRMLSDPEKYLELYNSDIVKFIENDEFYHNKDKFAAANFKKTITEKLEATTYIIASKNNTFFKTSTQNYYINATPLFTENREENNETDLFFGLGKLTLSYQPNANTDVKYSSFFKSTKPLIKNRITTSYLTANNTLESLNNANSIAFKNSFNFNIKLKDKHVLSAELLQDYKKETPKISWKTNQEILQGLVPLLDDSIYRIHQDEKIKKHKLDFILKEYWQVSQKHHLYTSVGFNFKDEKLISNEYQQLSNGTLNNFSSANFGNDINHVLINPYLKFEYKTKIGITTITPSVSYQLFYRKVNQLSGNRQNTKSVFIPTVKAKTEFSNSQKITYKYQLNTKFPTIENLANRNTLTNFNAVFMGDDSIENTLYHNFSLRYYRFSMYRKMNITASFNYRKKERSIKKATTLAGIESITIPISFNQPEHNMRFNTGVSKKIKKIKYFFKSAFNYDVYNQLTNNLIKKNKLNSNKFTFGATSYFKNLPNVALNFSRGYDKFRIEQLTTKYVTNELWFDIAYDYKGFIFKTDYSFTQNKNKRTQLKNNYEQANVSLFYQKKNCAWGFELAVRNLLDQKHKLHNFFSDYLITEQLTMVFPRTIMFQLSYKL